MMGKSAAERKEIAHELEMMEEAESNRKAYEENIDKIVYPLNDKKAGKTGYLFKQVGKHAKPGSLMCAGFWSLFIVGALMSLLGFFIVSVLFAMMEIKGDDVSTVNMWVYILLGYGIASGVF